MLSVDLVSQGHRHVEALPTSTRTRLGRPSSRRATLSGWPSRYWPMLRRLEQERPAVGA